MWVDQGTTLDYAVGSGSWHSEGFDTEKHLFTADDGSFWKIRGRGKDTTWEFSSYCSCIDNYQLENQAATCQYANSDNKGNCAKLAILDFSEAESMPLFTGMWDLESAGNQWTGDNAFVYNFKLFARKYTHVPFEDAGSVCQGKASGSYSVEGHEIECNNDDFNGGWIKVFDH